MHVGSGSYYPQGAAQAPWFLMQQGWTATWAPAPGGFRLTVARRREGNRVRFSAAGASMQEAWDGVRAALNIPAPPAPAGPGQGGRR